MSWLLGLQIGMFAIYVLWKRGTGNDRLKLRQDVYSSLWLIGFYALIMLVSCLGTFGGRGIISQPWDSLLVIAVAVAVYYWVRVPACRHPDSPWARPMRIEAAHHVGRIRENSPGLLFQASAGLLFAVASV